MVSKMKLGRQGGLPWLRKYKFVIMSDNQSNNKRIAKNTFFLYIRTLVLMFISLFTSRIILNALGVEDFGIYNVVGGFVALFSIITGTLTTAISRYLTFELGKGSIERLRTVFSTAVNVQLVMAVVMVLIIEVAGVWYVNTSMNLPAGRESAALLVLHCSAITFCINLLSIPYNASIIAHEKMDVFAYISIFEAILKLAVAYSIYITIFDKLQTFAVLNLCIAIILRLFYGFYCSHKFQECKYKFAVDKPLFKEMSNFAGWNFIGNSVFLLSDYGVNLVMNSFFGVTVNAARGVAQQVNSAVTQFVTNFTTALNPQITKNYAQGNYPYMHALICKGAKFSFFLMLFFAIPICMECDTLLGLWLGEVPEYASIFTRLSIASSLTVVYANTLVVAIQATGVIKRYQIITGLIVGMDIPLTYLAFKLGYSPIAAYVIYTAIYFLMIFVRLLIIKDKIKLSFMMYFKEVILRTFTVALVAVPIPLLLELLIDSALVRFLSVCVSSLLITALSIYVLGLNTNERNLIVNTIKSKIKYAKTQFTQIQ